MDHNARDAADDDSIASLLSRAVSDAEQVARAEIELQKARVVAKVDEARVAVLLLLASLAIGSVAVTALVIGMLMILTAWIGPIWATVVVVGALGGAAAVCGWLSLRQFKLIFGSTEKLPGSGI